MSKVEIAIGGRDFAFSCGPEDEARVRSLAESIDRHFQAVAPRFSQNLLFACLLAADEVYDKAGVSPGEDPEQVRMRERLAQVEHERDRLEAALCAATDARGRLERDMRQARDEAAAREAAESTAQAGRIEGLEARCADLQRQLEKAQSQELPFTAETNGDEPDLLPALERFAVLLESCADKLEGRARSA